MMVVNQGSFVCVTEVTEIQSSIFWQVLTMKPCLCVHLFIKKKKSSCDLMTYLFKMWKCESKKTLFHWQSIKFSGIEDSPFQFRGLAAEPTSRCLSLTFAFLSDNTPVCFSEHFILLLNPLGLPWFFKSLFETEAQKCTNLHVEDWKRVCENIEHQKQLKQWDSWESHCNLWTSKNSNWEVYYLYLNIWHI